MKKKEIPEGNYAGVSFKDQDLTGYTLRGNFTGADFRNATLTDADMSKGIFQDADFADSRTNNTGTKR